MDVNTMLSTIRTVQRDAAALKARLHAIPDAPVEQLYAETSPTVTTYPDHLGLMIEDADEIISHCETLLERGAAWEEA